MNYESTNSRVIVFIHTECICVSTAMQDCWLGHRALEKLLSREIIQPLHDSLSTHALEVTKLQSCLASIFSSLLDEALIIFSAVCSAH